MSLLADREVLYVFMSGTCEACAAADPEVTAFERKHPGVMTLRLSADGPLPERLGIKIVATPTYAFRRGDTAAVRAGALRAKDIESWLRKLGATL